MEELNAQYPGYGNGQHRGYGTAEHLKALEKLGPTPLHRMSIGVRLRFKLETLGKDLTYLSIFSTERAFARASPALLNLPNEVSNLPRASHSPTAAALLPF